MLGRFRKLVWDLSSRAATFPGKERLVAIVSRPRRLGEIVIEREGVAFAIRGHDLNEFVLAARAQHSAAVAAALHREITRRNVRCLWDIGANIGAIGLPLLKAHPGLFAVMFEPSVEVAGRLLGNIAHNPHLMERVRVMSVALAATEGLMRFHVSAPARNSGMGGLGPSDNRAELPLMVQAYPGDTLIAAGACPVPDLIKIDVEGFELDVFKGLERTLTLHRPTIVFEHSLKRLRERRLARDAVTGFLEALGYGVARLADEAPVMACDLDGNADFIAWAPSPWSGLAPLADKTRAEV
jgi:FkbM family methyltransferase